MSYPPIWRVVPLLMPSSPFVSRGDPSRSWSQSAPKWPPFGAPYYAPLSAPTSAGGAESPRLRSATSERERMAPAGKARSARGEGQDPAAIGLVLRRSSSIHHEKSSNPVRATLSDRVSPWNPTRIDRVTGGPIGVHGWGVAVVVRGVAVLRFRGTVREPRERCQNRCEPLSEPPFAVRRWCMTRKSTDVRAVAPCTLRVVPCDDCGTLVENPRDRSWDVVNARGDCLSNHPTRAGARAWKAREMARGTDRIGAFVDPHTDEILDTDVSPLDARGVSVVGEDRAGFWWGTERAAWCLSLVGSTVLVAGFLGKTAWTGYFIGTEAESVEYAECHGVRVTHVEDGDPAPPCPMMLMCEPAQPACAACRMRAGLSAFREP